MEKHIPAQVNEVVAAVIEDRPGSLANLLKYVRDAKINVSYSYAFAGFSSGKAVMIFKFSDNDKAIDVLQHEGVHLLDAESFGMLETKD